MASKAVGRSRATMVTKPFSVSADWKLESTPTSECTTSASLGALADVALAVTGNAPQHALRSDGSKRKSARLFQPVCEPCSRLPCPERRENSEHWQNLRSEERRVGKECRSRRSQE